MASDVGRLLGVAPQVFTPPRASEAVLPTLAPLSLDSLSRVLQSASLNDEGFRTNEEELVDAITEEAAVDHSFLTSAIERWTAKRGPEVLALASRGRLQATALALSVLQMAAGSEPCKGESDSFASASGIRDFCVAHADTIRSELVAHFRNSRDASIRCQRGEMSTRQAVTEAFASVLPWLCPNILQTPVLMGIAFAHRSLRIRLADPPQVMDIYLLARHDSVWADALPVLLGPTERLQRGIAGVRFSGDARLGPGVLRIWFREMTTAMTTPATGVFREESADSPYMQIAPADKNDPNWQQQYWTAGRFLALAVLHENPVRVSLPIMFYAQLINQRLTLDDIRQEEPHLHRSLSYLLTAHEAELEDYALTIRGQEYVPTVENRERLVEMKVNALFVEGVEDEFAAIRDGFNAVFSLQAEDLIGNAADWRTAIAGVAPIEVDDVIANMRFNGYSHNSEQIEWLRIVVREFSPDQVQAFVRLVTGRTLSRTDMVPPITVMINGELSTDAFPTAYAPASRLLLPIYGSLDELRRRLTWTILSYGLGPDTI